MSKPKRHHYVQRAHLDRWSDPSGNIYICDLTNGNIYEGPAKSAAWEKYYYSIDDPKHPEFKFEIEEFLGTDIEGPAVPIIQKFCDDWRLSAEEKDKLALYIAFQKLRVPFFEKFSNQIAESMTKEGILKTLKDDHQFGKFMTENAEKYNAIGKPPSREELIKTVEENRIKIEYPRAQSLKNMLQLSLPLNDLYLQSRWVLLEAKESSFIISDNPAVTIYLGKKDGNTGVSETTFPLSPKYCLLINQEERGEIVASDESADGVKELNRRTLLHATRFLFGNDRVLLEESYKEFKRLEPLSTAIQNQQSNPLVLREKLFLKRIFGK